MLTGTRGKVVLALIVLVAAVVGVRLYMTRTVSYEFAGNVQSAEGNVIVLYGQFVLPDGSSAEGKGKTVEVTVPVGIEIKREGFRIPSDEELEATGGLFRPDELPKEVSVVGVEQVAADAAAGTAGMRVKAAEDIFGESAFEAVEVSYRTAVFAR